MVRHGGSSAGSYLADPTSPIPSHCASIVMTSTLRVNRIIYSPTQHRRLPPAGQTMLTHTHNNVSISRNMKLYSMRVDKHYVPGMLPVCSVELLKLTTPNICWISLTVFYVFRHTFDLANLCANSIVLSMMLVYKYELVLCRVNR